MTLTDFLVWLGTGGSIMAVSFIMERIPWFQNLVAKTKEIVMFGFSALLACLATAALQFVPAETLTLIAPYFASVSAVFGLVFLAKTFHFFDKKPTPTTTNTTNIVAPNVTTITSTTTTTPECDESKG